MNGLLQRELRRLVPAWLGCVLLPVPALVLSPSDEGVPWRFAGLSVGCAGLVAFAFQRYLKKQPATNSISPQLCWKQQTASVAMATLAAAVVFYLLALISGGTASLVVLFKAIYVAVLAVCIVPYLTLVTRHPFASVVFSIFLVFGLKLLGCLIVVLVYGWDASERGYTTTPWADPNLLVWLFWIFSAILAVSFYFLGAIKFRTITRPKIHDAAGRLSQSSSSL